jgi:hypothetical protein
MIHSYGWYLWQDFLGCGAMALVAAVGTLSVDWLLKRIDEIATQQERAAKPVQGGLGSRRVIVSSSRTMPI